MYDLWSRPSSRVWFYVNDAAARGKMEHSGKFLAVCVCWGGQSGDSKGEIKCNFKLSLCMGGGGGQQARGIGHSCNF